jgi:RNA 2',3'-cyclic 3'-phosphodiesterase
MRCFIGLPLPETYQQGLFNLVNRWKPRLCSRMSWVRPGNWHLTLKFLGEVSMASFEALVSAFQEPLGGPFDFQGKGGGFFPSIKRPRVLWVGVDRGSDALRVLAGEVDRRCTAHDFPPEQRAFVSHLTVARIKQAEVDPWSEVLADLDGMCWPKIEVDRIVLWESRLTSQGPRYESRAEFRLPAAP